MDISNDFFNQIVQHLPEGIIVMDQIRKIHYLNDKAVAMTGWKLGEMVPYCSYCQQREINDEENRCILTEENPIPFFQSHMAVYAGMEELEMTVQKIAIEQEEFFVLRIQQPVQNEHSERARFHEVLLQETMRAQEAERKKIARELHDHIGQSVYSIFLGLEVIKQNINEERYQSHVTNMINVMEKTLNDIKRLTKCLRPEMIYHIGLKESLREAVKDWMKLYQIVILLEIDIKQETDYDPEKELHLFRIIQEGIGNAVRHGKANSITIHLKSYFEYIFFHILDNGQGFDETNTGYKGLGLKHMVERSRMLEGDIRWISKPGGPTKVEGFVSLIAEKEEKKNEFNDCG